MNNPQEIIENLQRLADNDAAKIIDLRKTIDNQNTLIHEQRKTINELRTDLATLNDRIRNMTASNIPNPSARVKRTSLQAAIDLAAMQSRTTEMPTA